MFGSTRSSLPATIHPSLSLFDQDSSAVRPAPTRTVSASAPSRMDIVAPDPPLRHKSASPPSSVRLPPLPTFTSTSAVPRFPSQPSIKHWSLSRDGVALSPRSTSASSRGSESTSRGASGRGTQSSREKRNFARNGTTMTTTTTTGSRVDPMDDRDEDEDEWERCSNVTVVDRRERSPGKRVRFAPADATEALEAMEDDDDLTPRQDSDEPRPQQLAVAT
ncbi:hypothetical protein JCM3766R1_007085 [Sporobolomyces carnicolor]